MAIPNCSVNICRVIFLEWRTCFQLHRAAVISLRASALSIACTLALRSNRWQVLREEIRPNYLVDGHPELLCEYLSSDLLGMEDMLSIAQGCSNIAKSFSVIDCMYPSVTIQPLAGTARRN